MIPEDYLSTFRHHIVQDALTEATQGYWLRRATVLEAARHRPGRDYTGRVTVEELRARWVALTEAAAACRGRASLGFAPEASADVDLVLEEAA